jgi:hypothetical protein
MNFNLIGERFWYLILVRKWVGHVTGPACGHPLLGLGPVAHRRLAPPRSNTGAILYFVYRYRFKTAENVILLRSAVDPEPFGRVSF